MANSKLNKLTKNGVTYDLQDKEISDKLASVNGIIKDNAGTLTTAVQGTDYGYPLLKGAGAPSTSTIASVGQHYFDTSAVKAPYEYVCVAAGSTYTWTEAGGGGAGSSLIADEYSASSAYAIGDVVIYEDGLYKCNTTISSGEAWTASHWTATAVDTLIGELQTTTNNLNSTVSNHTTSINSLNSTVSNHTTSINSLNRAINSKAPMYTYGTTDLTAGSSALTTGQLHFVYE